MTEDRPLTWGEIYERLARRSDRPDARAWAVLGERVRAWARDAGLADDTCAEVWRTFNAARGGASFEGFVQGRLVAVTRRRQRLGGGSPGDGQDEAAAADSGARLERLAACLEELQTRNPSHQRVLTLLYADRTTVEEAAELLGIDPWAARSQSARARMALAQCLERAARQRGSRTDDDAVPDRPEGKQRRSGHRAGRSAAPPGRQPKGRPRRGGRPR